MIRLYNIISLLKKFQQFDIQHPDMMNPGYDSIDKKKRKKGASDLENA